MATVKNKKLPKFKLNLLTVVNWVFAKITSVRLIITIAFTYTYCTIMLSCLEMVKSKIMGLETFLGILAGFTPLVILIVEWYFKRDDRQKEDYGKEKKND